MTTLNRRKALTAIAVAPAAVAWPVSAREGDTLERIRAFARELLTVKTDPLTAGEWVERKRIANSMLFFIGDEPEPWKPWEAGVIREIDQKRVAPIWRAGS